MRKRILCLIILSFPLLLHSQSKESSQGIKFSEGLSWKEVLKKAKKENKYIFLDCYTTWCKPCTLMDKEVYSKKEVGDFYNKNFISVRSQMNRTDKDSDDIKSWYKEADRIKEEYGIPVYPTYLYFSPDGKLVSRDQGYKRENDFIFAAKRSMDPHQQGIFLKYYSMLARYLEGKMDYRIMPALIDTARQLHQDDVLKNMVTDYQEYIEKLSESDLYTKDHIAFITSITKSSKDKFFKLFYPSSKKVDSVMEKKGYGQLVVDEIIINEDIEPQLRIYDVEHKNDLSQLSKQYRPDWVSLIKRITEKYNDEFANRTVLRSETKWLQSHHNWGECAEYFTVLVNNYLMDNYTEELDLWVNGLVWDAIFKRSVDKDQIDAAIECMRGVVERQKKWRYYACATLDTYANLLYKAGNVKEAILTEEAIIQRLIELKTQQSFIDTYQETLNKMKTGKPTWPRYIDRKDIFGDGLL
jgi:thioredoxin-related protein